MVSRSKPRSVPGLLYLLTMAVVTWSSVSTVAYAAECGDAVAGKRVACACGDIVVSNTRLLPDDPVVTERCLLDGLIVRAGRSAETITLELAGLSIIGRGYGTGIRVDWGGDDGAVINGGSAKDESARAEIVGFSNGIVASRQKALRRLEGVRVRGSRRDGIRLRTSGTIIVDVEASDSGHHGFSLGGEGGRMDRVAAHRNAATGIQLRSSGVVVSGEVSNNKLHGIVSDGKENDIRGVIARDNGGRGVVILGVRQSYDGIVSESNGMSDLLPPARESQP